MGNTVANVSTGKPKIGGAVYNAPLGTTLPVSASSALGDAFKCLGYCSEDGLANSNAPNTDTVKAWGGDIVLVTESEKNDEFKYTLLEVLNVDVLKAVYGSANVSGTLETGITVRANSAPGEASVWVFDLAMRNGAMKRIVVPNGMISDLDDIEYTDSDAVGYNISLTAMPGDENFGYDTHKEYIYRPYSAGPTGATGATGATGG